MLSPLEREAQNLQTDLKESLIGNSDNTQSLSINFALEVNTSEMPVKKYSLSDVIEKYDEFKIPPNPELIQIHANASRVGIPLPQLHSIQAQYKSNLCQCCERTLNKKEISLLCELNELQFLGSGVVLYFYYVKSMIIFLGIICLLYFIPYVIITFYAIQDLKEVQGTNIFSDILFCWFAILKDKDPYLTWYTEISYTATLTFCILYLLLLKKILKQKIQYKTQKQQDAGNYSLLVNNIPKQATPQDLKNLIRDKILTSKKFRLMTDYEIFENIFFLLEYEEYYILNNKKHSLLQQQFKLNNIFKNNNEIVKSQLLEIQTQIQITNQRLQGIEDIYLKNPQLKQTDVALVIFKKQEYAQYVFKKLYHPNFFQRLFTFLLQPQLIKSQKKINELYFLYDQPLIMEKGPRAEDIIWQNIGKKRLQTFGRRLLALSFFLLNSVMSCLIGYFLHILEFRENIFYSIWTVYGIIFGINVLSNVLITKYSEYENHIKYSKEANSVLNKAVFYNLLNSILMPLVFLILRYISTKNKESYEKILYQMSTSIFTLSLMNSFLPQVFNAFSFEYMLKLIKRRKFVRDILNSLTQQKAHEVFQGTNFNIGRRYAHCFTITLFTCFYISISPAVVLVGMLALTIGYWVDKILLLRRHILPRHVIKDDNTIDPLLFKSQIGCFLFVLSVRILGPNLVKFSAFTKQTVYSLVAALLFFLFSSFFIRYAVQVEKDKQSFSKRGRVTYQQMQTEFVADYYTEYPVSRIINKII